jgi:hypothetical protein
MNEEISPDKFSKLPPELQARILRSATGRTFSTHHRELTIADRIIDAGSKPFAEEEVEWLYNSLSDTAIVYIGENRDSGRIYFAGERDEPGFAIIIDVNYKNNKILYKYTGGSQYGSNELDKVINRLDTGIKRKLDSEVNFLRNYITIVLPDIRCIFYVFLRRFSIIMTTGSFEKAREWTQQILNNIVDDLAPKRTSDDDPLKSKLPILLLYLTVNLSLFSKPPIRYINNDKNLHIVRKEINNEYLDNIENKCKELYQELSLKICILS